MPNLSRTEMEERRLQAAVFLAAGVYQTEVARKFHVSRHSVWRWALKLKIEGAEALRKHSATGRPPMVTITQIREIYRQREKWTAVTLAGDPEVLRGSFHRDHVSRILKRLRAERAQGAAA